MTKKQLIIASVLGNALEFYDITLFAVFAAVIAKLLFPLEEQSFATLMTWGTFMTAFIMRPFGATVFGYIGDRWGRKKALTLSVLLMGIPTFLMGLTPGSQDVGLWAPALVILCRMFQGLCAGGEYNGSAIFALEHVGKDRPGMIGGIVTGSCIVGTLLAYMAGALALADGMPDWAWRVPFMLGGLISIVGVYLRRNLAETPEFEAMQAKPKKRARSPLLLALSRHKKAVVTTIVLGAVNGILSYTLIGFTKDFVAHCGVTTVSESIHFNMFGLTVYMLTVPFMGLWLDKVGARKFLTRACVFVFCGAPIAFSFFIQGSMGMILMGHTILGLMVASIAGPIHALSQTLFPVEDRYSGVAFSHSLGMALGSSTILLGGNYLFQCCGPTLHPAFFIMGWAGLGMFVLMRRSKKRTQR